MEEALFLYLKDEADETELLIIKSHFIVSFVGSSEVSEDYCAVQDCQDHITDFYDTFVKRVTKNVRDELRLIIDLDGAMVCDKEGNNVQCFSLENIKNIVYCNGKQPYCKYFILVGREKYDGNLNAYVYVCESKQKAREIYTTFIRTFAMVFEMGNNIKTTSNTKYLSQYFSGN